MKKSYNQLKMGDDELKIGDTVFTPDGKGVVKDTVTPSKGGRIFQIDMENGDFRQYCEHEIIKEESKKTVVKG